jgi:two-component system response regulator NreC
MSCEQSATQPPEPREATVVAVRAGSRQDPSPPALIRRTTRILVVDEEGIMRDGLCALLASDDALQIVGTTSSGREAVWAASGVRPDVVVMDFSMSLKTGPEAIGIIKRHWPSARVLVLTFRHADQFIDAALRAGADGYVLKNDRRTELFTAIHSIAAGKNYISPSIFDRVVSGYVKAPDSARHPGATATGILTKREQEVIALIGQGHRTREIAQLLSLSHKTVEKHRTNLMRKLGLRNATAVAAYASAHGYLDL